MDIVRFGSGTEAAGGLLVRPEGEGPHPAVVVVPAIAGVNDYIGRVCGRLAAAGYVALGLDYYLDREPPDLSGMDRIMAAVASLSDPDVMRRLQAVVDGLRGTADVQPDNVGIVGFCIGGTYALLAASQTEGIKCSVAYYGQLRYRETTDNKPLSPLDAIGDLRAPLLGHFGTADQLIPTEHVGELRAATLGRQAEIYSYPGAGHAFDEDFRDVYRPVAAHSAWQRTSVFLDWYLRGRRTP